MRTNTHPRVSSGSGDAILMSVEDYDSWQETIYLLRSPANARRLMEAIARDKGDRSAVYEGPRSKGDESDHD